MFLEKSKLKDDSSNDADCVRDLRIILITAQNNNVLDAPLGDGPIAGADAVPARRRDGEVPPEGFSIDTTAIFINAAVSHEEGVVLHRGSGLYR